MPRYIDADALLERMEARLKQLRTEYGDYDHYTDGFDEGLVAVEDADTADVVEVVRCKDCIHWGGVTYGFACRKFSGIETKICMGADHFCSYGEKKES